MNPNKMEHQQEDLFHHNHHHHHHQVELNNPYHHQSEPSILDLPQISEIDLFHDSSDSDNDETETQNAVVSNKNKTLIAEISPLPHLSSQFYTFNQQSHSLMISCILQNRLATPEEIKAATPPSVLSSWRSVWKDRNQDTAYLTAWKRIQDKLIVLQHHGNTFSDYNYLCFKNNTAQFVSHFGQWLHIVMSNHADADFKHLGLKDTIDRIKQAWTVGAKFYGIPESFIKLCVAKCPVCSAVSGSGMRSKRRRFEYTESFDVPAKEVPTKLQELAAKHKVALCIRQKYIRYKPFMAEVKDYACHRAGEPAAVSKKSKLLKREHYASKRCGCGFRIRAIVPISNYNEKDKTFVYQEEGVAVFKLYAVHSGHEPGPLDGNARIMHRVVGHKGGFLLDQDFVYGMAEEVESEGYGLGGQDDGDFRQSVLQQVKELRNELGFIEGKIGKIPSDLLGSVSQELFDIVNKLRSVREHGLSSAELLSIKPQSDDLLVGENDLADWSGHHQTIYGVGKDAELIEDDNDSFGRTLGDVASWDQIRSSECQGERDLLGETCKPDKWLKCGEFDEKSILNYGDSKLIKPIRDDETIEHGIGLNGLQAEGFYPENTKWYDSPCGFGSSADCGNNGFRPGETV